MQNKQKGQSIIEFALVLPLFLLLVFGLFYIGMFFADYLMLSSIARSSAREASIIVDDKEVERDYPSVKNNYENYKLPMDIYDWNPKNNFNIKNVKINDNDSSTNVVVTINASLNDNGLMLVNIVNKLADITDKDTTLNITYTMYSEYKK